MSRRVENGCVGCGLPCIGRACPHREEEHFYCDECDEEVDYDRMNIEDNGEELCDDCHQKRMGRDFDTEEDD